MEEHLLQAFLEKALPGFALGIGALFLLYAALKHWREVSDFHDSATWISAGLTVLAIGLGCLAAYFFK